VRNYNIAVNSPINTIHPPCKKKKLNADQAEKKGKKRKEVIMNTFCNDKLKDTHTITYISY